MNYIILITKGKKCTLSWKTTPFLIFTLALKLIKIIIINLFLIIIIIINKYFNISVSMLKMKLKNAVKT